MKNIFLIFSLVVAITVKGQTSLLGVKGGISWTNIPSHIFNDNAYFRTGLAIGLTYDYTFKKYFSTGVDIVYNQRGFSDDWPIFFDAQGNKTDEKARIYYNYDYVTLPLKVGFNYGDKFYGFVDLGFTPSLLINANVNEPEFIEEIGALDPTHYVKTSVFKRMRKFDIGGLAEIGGGYKFKERYWLYLSFSYQHSFTSFSNKTYWDDPKMRHYGMFLSVGLKIQVG